ncbi:MAG: hypothetical protein ACW97X_05955 [Candidatus Hodarchaeales archaeon]
MNGQSLSHKQILILSMIGEFDLNGISGKQINKLIEERNVRVWTKISFSNVYYILDRLETNKFIIQRTTIPLSRGVGAPEKTFSLTKKGKGTLKEVALEFLSGKEVTILELDLGMAASYVLSPVEVVQALKQHFFKLNSRYEALEYGYELQGGDKLHYQAWGVINHHRYITKSRLELISELINRIENTQINNSE